MTASNQEVLALFNDYLVKGQANAVSPRRQAEINEDMYNNKQFGAVTQDPAGRTIYEADSWDKNLPRMTINIVRGLVMVWSALINRARASVSAFAASPDPQDSYSADVANNYIRFIIQEEKTAEKLTAALQQCCLHGISGIRVHYDAEKDRIQWDNISIFDFYIDNKANFDDVRWVIFEKYVDEDTAEALCDQYRYKYDGVLPVGPYKTPDGSVSDGVLVHELYLRPNKKHPKGLYALIIGGQVCMQMDYPLVTTNDGSKPEYLLPLVLMKARTVRSSMYGMTNLSDVIPLQRLVNEMTNRELLLLRESTGIKISAPNDIMMKWEPGENQIFGYNTGDPNATHGINIIPVPEPSPAFSRIKNEAIAAMPGVLGLNDASTGTENRTYSGVALEALFTLDQQKNQDTARSFENMVIDAFRLHFALSKIYYTVPRQMRITNSDHYDVVAFDAADIEGADLRLEPASELDKLSEVERAQAEAKLKDGTGTQMQLEKASNSPQYGISLQASRKLISDYLAGHTLADPRPGVDFNIDIFDQELAKAKGIALQEGRKQDWIALHALSNEVHRLAAEGADAPPPPGEGPKAPAAPQAAPASPQADISGGIQSSQLPA